MMQITLTQMAVNVLNTKDGREKDRAVEGGMRKTGATPAPAAQRLPLAQPDHQNIPPGPTSLTCSARARFPSANPARWPVRLQLLHAVAHIELNAVDLHWDIIARFCHIDMPIGFYDDWVQASDDEVKTLQPDVRLSRSIGQPLWRTAGTRRNVARCRRHC